MPACTGRTLPKHKGGEARAYTCAQDLLGTARIVPAVEQVEGHAYFRNQYVIAWCKRQVAQTHHPFARARCVHRQSAQPACSIAGCRHAAVMMVAAALSMYVLPCMLSGPQPAYPRQASFQKGLKRRSTRQGGMLHPKPQSWRWVMHAGACAQGIHVTTYSPLGTPDPNSVSLQPNLPVEVPPPTKDALVARIAQKHGKHAAQVRAHAACLLLTP